MHYYSHRIRSRYRKLRYYYGLMVAQPICRGWPENKMVAPINVLAFRCLAMQQILVFTCTQNNLYRLLQSTVTVLLYRNCSKVANLKWSKLRIVHLLLQTAQRRNAISVAFKTATSSQELAGDGPFELCFEHNCNLTPAIFVGKTVGAELYSCWTPFIGAHARMR